MSRKSDKTATIVTVFCFENILILDTLKGKVVAFRIRKVVGFRIAHIKANLFTPEFGTFFRVIYVEHDFDLVED